MRIAFALTFLLAGTALGQPAEFRPAVLSGEEAPNLLGADVTAPVCYAFVDGAWRQCPLQVDERALLDRGSNYPQDLWGEFYGVDSTYHYTAPQDYPTPGFNPYVGPDPDLTLDADDEIVVMARHFGLNASATSTPIPYAPAVVHEVEADGRFAYLFVPTVPLDQSAGETLVDYSFDLLAGSFPDDYDFSSSYYSQHNNDDHKFADSLGANPEYSVASTAYYRTSFEDRWMQREWQFADAGGLLGADLLDRVKMAPYPDYSQDGCNRTIWTGSSARGTLGVQKSGPVRAFRVVQGYNSGGFNETTYVMYERYVEVRNVLAMHRTRVSLWYDLSEAALGSMLYTNALPGGVLIDGEPDYAEGEVFPAITLEWDYLIGDEGSLVGTWETHTNVTDLGQGSYYEDDRTPAISNCGGDREALGNYGNTYFASNNKGFGSTDPSEPEAYFEDDTLRRFAVTRRLVPERPNLPTTEAEALVSRLQTPLSATVTTVTPVPDVAAPRLDGTLGPDGTTLDGTAEDLESGVASLKLGGSSDNLGLTVAPFSPGTSLVPLTTALVDPTRPGSGYVVATDMAGNADSLFVELTPLPDDHAPQLLGALIERRFDGSATDSTASDTGLDTVVLSPTAANLTLQADAFAPGASAVEFAVTSLDSTSVGEGYVVATDLAGNADSLLVTIQAVVPDTIPPVVSGALLGRTYSGSASDSLEFDRGLETIALDAEAANLTLGVATFALGAPYATFTATAIDSLASAQGYVVARDLVGNADSVWVEIAAIPDTTLPTLDGDSSGGQFEGEARDGQSGIGVLGLGTSASNLALSASPFTAGDTLATFSATPADTTRAASGFVVATDVAGNTDSLWVEILPPTDNAVPVLDGAIVDRQFDGSASDSTAFDTGIASIQRSADAANLTLSVGPFESGAGAVDFSATPTISSDGASGYVIATDVAGNVDSIRVEIAPPPDVSDPVLAGQFEADAFEGTATDSAATDTGIATVNLGGESINLTLDVDPFDQGAPSVRFTASAVNVGAPASGYVIATDRAGNADSIRVELTPSDLAAPSIEGIPEAQRFEGSATDSAATDTGIAALALGSGAANLVLTVDPFDPGASLVPFEITPDDATLDAEGYVIATDVAGNADSLFVALSAPVLDTTAPMLAGSTSGSTYSGTAMDEGADQTGIQSVVLGASSSNLNLTTDPFAPGSQTVSFAASSVDRGVVASGFVIATDVTGNADSVYVAFDAAPDYDLTIALAYTFSSDTGGSITATAYNLGTEPMTDVRIKRTRTDGVSVNPKQLLVGAVDPGGSASVTFTFTNAQSGASARFKVQDLVVRVRDEADGSNNLAEVLLDPSAALPDETPPVLAGTATAGRFDGTAAEQAPGDEGIASVVLGVSATNLLLDVTPFVAGGAVASFTASLADPSLSGEGYVVATDLAGNADSLLITLDPPPPDTSPPALTGTYAALQFNGTASDAQPTDSGLASIQLAGSASNVTLSVDPFAVGAPDVDFSISLTDPSLLGSGYVRATDVAGNADSLRVELEPSTEPVFDLTISLAYTFSSDTGGSITATAHNLGTEPMTDVRIKRTRTDGVSVNPKQLLVGAVDPGGSASVTFTFTNAQSGASARFKVQDLVVRVRDEADGSNNLAEVLLDPGAAARVGATDEFTATQARHGSEPGSEPGEARHGAEDPTLDDSARDESSAVDDEHTGDHEHSGAAGLDEGVSFDLEASPPAIDSTHVFTLELDRVDEAIAQRGDPRAKERPQPDDAALQGEVDLPTMDAAHGLAGPPTTDESAVSGDRVSGGGVPGDRDTSTRTKSSTFEGLASDDPAHATSEAALGLPSDAATAEPTLPGSVASEAESPSEPASASEPGAEDLASSGSASAPSQPSEAGTRDSVVDQPLKVEVYPNPSASALTLRLYTAEPGPLTVYVYDLTGREVARIYDQYADAGWHAIPFQADGLPNGVFIWQASSALATRSGRLIRVR